MNFLVWDSLPRSSVKALLDHLGEIDYPREPWRVARPLSEVLLLVVCATVCDCDDHDVIAEWGEANLAMLRCHLPFYHGVLGGRWLTLLMNRIDPDLFAQAFTDWVRATWPTRPGLIAIDGRTPRRSHDRVAESPPLQTVSAFATKARLVLARRPCPTRWAKPPPSRSCSNGSAKAMGSRARPCPSSHRDKRHDRFRDPQRWGRLPPKAC